MIQSIKLNAAATENGQAATEASFPLPSGTGGSRQLAVSNPSIHLL